MPKLLSIGLDAKPTIAQTAPQPPCAGAHWPAIPTVAPCLGDYNYGSTAGKTYSISLLTLSPKGGYSNHPADLRLLYSKRFAVVSSLGLIQEFLDMKIQRREIIKAMLLVATCAMLCGGYAMAQPQDLKLWECGNCKQQRWDRILPSLAGCPNGGTHFWSQKN